MSQHDDNNEDVFLPQSERLQILSPEEYDLLWGQPRFSQYDRDLFFSITAREEQVLKSLRTARTKAHFLLALGHFRARQRFYRFGFERVRDDVEYLCRRYLDNTAAVTDLAVSKHTRSRYILQAQTHEQGVGVSVSAVFCPRPPQTPKLQKTLTDRSPRSDTALASIFDRDLH